MSLAPDEIEVLRFALDDDSSISLSEARTWLSREETSRAGQFKFEILRERYIRGRGMLRRELARHLGCSPGELQFGLGPHGKPFLVDRDLHFNLSHSGDVAALAISPLRSIGIDIEKFDRKVDYDGLAKRCFRDNEWSGYADAPEPEKVCRFFHLWTAKEARMKATGEGFQLSPLKIEIAFRDGVPVACIEPVEPAAFIEAVRFSGIEAACTVAALAPFRVSLEEG